MLHMCMCNFDDIIIRCKILDMIVRLSLCTILRTRLILTLCMCVSSGGKLKSGLFLVSYLKASYFTELFLCKLDD